MRTIPQRGRQTLCHQYQSGDILNETLIKILHAETSTQLRHLLDQFGERLVPSIVDSPTETSLSPAEFGEQEVHRASAIATLFATGSPPSILLLDASDCHRLQKLTPPLAHSKATNRIAPTVADNRTKNHSSDGTDANANCINTSANIDWYIQLASKCYTDGFLSHVNHLDECSPCPRSALAIDSKLQRQHIESPSAYAVSPLPSTVCKRSHQRRHRRRPLKPLRSTNLFSSSSRAVHSATASDNNATSTNCCNSFENCDSQRINRRITRTSGIGSVVDRSGCAHADDTMNRGFAPNSAQGLQHHHFQPQHQNHNHTSHTSVDDQNNRFVYADDRMNIISPTIANRVNDLINSFYTLNLTAADDYSLPQIILTDFSNNSLQPTTTPLFLSTTETPSSAAFHPAVVSIDIDSSVTTSTSSSHPQFVADDSQLAETKSQQQLQFTFNGTHFAASPNCSQFHSNGSRSFHSN